MVIRDDNRLPFPGAGPQPDPSVVVIGGGTGAYTAPMGLQRYTPHLSAIISMAESGGSTENAHVPIEHVPLDPPAEANPKAVRAIEEADVVLLGPGDLYSSLIPNLLVRGIPEAIRRSRAAKVYVCNIMTKHGETDDYRVSDFLRQILRYLGDGAVLDYAVVNYHERIPTALRGEPVRAGEHRPLGAAAAARGPTPHGG